jgi:hypothetical protein
MAGQTTGVRFAEEQRHFRLAPTAFAPEATTLATVSPPALVRLEGAYYSVPSRWAGLDLVVRIGATSVTLVGREGTRIRHPRKRFGQRSMDYRHYPWKNIRSIRKPHVVDAGAQLSYEDSPFAFPRTGERVDDPWRDTLDGPKRPISKCRRRNVAWHIEDEAVSSTV